MLRSGSYVTTLEGFLLELGVGEYVCIHVSFDTPLES